MATGNDLVYYDNPLNGGIADNAANGFPMIVIEEQSGNEFDFRGIELSEYLGGGYTIKIEGKRNGISTGSITTTVGGDFIELLDTNDLNRSIFQNVDRVEITDNAGSDIYIYINKITLGIPVTTTTPTVTTATASGVTATTATLGGNVTDNGGDTVTQRGIVYNTSGTPNVNDDTIITIGSGDGSFSDEVTGLTAETQYYVRAYAINGEGTSYGSQETFTTNVAEICSPTIGSIITFEAGGNRLITAATNNPAATNVDNHCMGVSSVATNMNINVGTMA